MHQSTTPSLSQTIWPRRASRQFVNLPIVQTLLPVTFDYSLSSEAVVMWQLRRWKRLWWRSLTRPQKRTSMGPTQKLLERHNKSIATGGDNFKGDKSFMCVLWIKVPIRKKSQDLSNDARIYIYILRYYRYPLSSYSFFEPFKSAYGFYVIWLEWLINFSWLIGSEVLSDPCWAIISECGYCKSTIQRCILPV